MLPVHVTVAAVIENDGKYLMVEEHTSIGIGFNQPAGHLDPDESLEHAVKREVLEETGLNFTPESLVGIYTLNPASNGRYYQRFCFTGKIEGTLETKPQDPDIIAAHWMTLDEILACQELHRSGLTVKCLEDYLNGQRYSLDTLHHSNDETHLQKQSIKSLNQQL
ncbi:NUDIX hydrolase [Kangiella sediminilitoris]|uniref:Phosphatase NudJ n=1 Tax=Kangiella sediminilitoris TaxID=1144748 RepID=A0A1B3BB28_9GAMM|nr:NUDIX hydrolase [Kangiella sediminilitoris]AOE49974.1 NUDIX hydrolase [Kangiella sediminilitoris]